jgi:hypothetical protein
MAPRSPCPRCGHLNELTSASCQACEHPLLAPAVPARRCGMCGAPVDAARPFCGRCGQPVATGVRALPKGAPRAAAQAAAQGIVRPFRLVPMRHDGLAGAPHALGPEGLVCGRTQGEILFPDDASVSPRHAQFFGRADAVVVEDLGSLNGTFVRLRGPRALANGDEIRLGRQRLRVEPQPRPAAAGARSWGSPDPGYRVRVVQVLEGGGTGEGFPLRAGENAIGREVGVVSFPLDRYVSARHARLDVSDSSIWITDLGSSNGTFVRIAEPATLGAGDQVFVGMQLMRIER